jgi:hypothetical protein
MQILFFELIDHRNRTDLQHSGGVPNAAGIHSHLDNLSFDCRCLTGIAIVEQKGTAFAFATLAAAVALFAF